MLGGCICRWLLLFQEYDFEVIVKPGRLNAGLDHLSCIKTREEPIPSFFPRSTKRPLKCPKFQTQAKLSSFSRSKLNPFTKATQIQPKTKEGKVEPKAEREKGERQL